jgi:uncharacterized membrane protein
MSEGRDGQTADGSARSMGCVMILLCLFSIKHTHTTLSRLVCVFFYVVAILFFCRKFLSISPRSRDNHFYSLYNDARAETTIATDRHKYSTKKGC